MRRLNGPPLLRWLFHAALKTPKSAIEFRSIRHFSLPVQQQQLSWGNSSSTSEILLSKLESAIKAHDADAAWTTFSDYKSLYGLPKRFLVSRLVGMLAYASDHRWLHKAYELVSKGEIELPYDNSLLRLSLALARAQVPVPAASVLRTMLEKDEFLSIDIVKPVLFHMVRSEIGACLASNVLVEICECVLRNRTERKNIGRLKLMTPDTALFNVVLGSCVRFRSVFKAQQIIELMGRVGVQADANSINIIACVYEMCGQREVLMNLEEHVSYRQHYQKFYDCLLGLHFKFNDIDAAADLMLGLFRNSASCCGPDIEVLKNKYVEKQCEIQIGSSNLKTGFKIMAKPERLPCDFVFQSLDRSKLVVVKSGKLVPSSEAISKLVSGYLREKRVEDLSNLLVSIHKEMKAFYASDVCSEVVDACVQLGWLDAAHDILDNLEGKVSVNFSSYEYLARGYYADNREKEAKLLIKQMKKTDSSMPFCFGKLTSVANMEATNINKKIELVRFLEAEFREDAQACQSVNELNSSIFFFCKAKMMEDAMKTLRKMQQNNVLATVQTFVHLVNGYSSMEMYREITILWGEIKRRIEDGVLTANRDLLDCLLWVFIRGGYFERVMEVIHYMNDKNIYIDKLMYKREFLKFHRSLYWKLKSSDMITDVQKKRIEHVQAFRKWAGI